MRAEVEGLINAVLDEADCIDDMIEAIREQRQAMRERDAEAVNALMNETRDLSFEAQSQEKLRDGLTRKFAEKYSCETNASSLVSVMEEDEKEEFNGAVDKLTQSVFVLKSEMMILTGLIDQHEQYTSMLLSEFRRLNGDVMGKSGSADFRG